MSYDDAVEEVLKMQGLAVEGYNGERLKRKRSGSLTEEGSVTVLHIRALVGKKNDGFCDMPESVRGGADLISSALVRAA
jgi:hypothetical protein